MADLIRSDPLKQKKAQDVAAWLLIAVLAAIILKTLSFLFIPLSISLLFCYALGAPLDFLERMNIPGYLRIVIVVLFVLLLFYLLGSLVNTNIEDFLTKLPEFEKKFDHYLNLLLGRFNITSSKAREMLSAFLANIKTADLKPVGLVVQQVGSSFFSFLGNLIWVLLFVVFILAETGSMEERLKRGVGDHRSKSMISTVRRINRAVQHYLGMKTLISLITGVLIALAMWIFKVPFAFLWGVLAFLLNFIPNIGSLVATIPPVLVALFNSGSFGNAFAVAAVAITIHMTVGNFLEPRLMGKGLNISPLVVLLSLVFWGWMWGPVGMLLSVPLTAAMKIAFEQTDSMRPLAVLMSSQ